ncbi:MAG: glycosyltransferase family 2 protein [Tepidisphaeraceae bacterium]|jgi:dolichol-phosphate mannosyltransferase
MQRTYHPLVARKPPELLSIIIPLYNEQEVVPELRRRMTAVLDALDCRSELILVNDGSGDRTIDLLLQWAADDSRVHVLGLARNFGHQLAITAGLDNAWGDAVVIMDADLQDPPELIHDMLREYQRGYDVVYGRRTGREGETRFKRLCAWGFYRLMRSFVHAELPVDAGDFRLISRRSLETLQQMRETHRFLRGMTTWIGFPQTAVEYCRAPRSAGESNYPLSKLLRLAWTAVVSFSPAPLRISLFAGALLLLFGAGDGLYVLIRAIQGHREALTWFAGVAAVSLSFGAVLLAIGILGEYVGRLYDEIKGRPLYVVGIRANVELSHRPVQLGIADAVRRKALRLAPALVEQA